MKVVRELRPYQIDISDKAVKVLRELDIVYLSMAVRCGKTLTSLETALKYGAKSVLFLTKKKAISSIESDYSEWGYSQFFKLTICNDESMHKIEGEFDLVIHDEHHRFGAFPKPSQGAKLFKKMYGHLPQIYLSGTPSPESYSQLFHQFWVSNRSPFKHKNFYQWAKEFVTVKDRHLGYAVVKDYSDADWSKIQPIIAPYMISFTQEQAGFTSKVNEHVLYVPMKESTYKLIKRLQKDLVIEGKEEVILADTAVKLMQKTHQLFSGTVKFESGNAKVLDYSKAEFIRDHFKGKKIGIFYKFKAELEALKYIFGDFLTTDLEDFNNSDRSIALQIVSGREGISLKKADYLVFYNIDFSAVSYFQAIDRLTTMERLTNDVYWVFAEAGIEEKIYKSVQSKVDYTLRHFVKQYKIKKS